MSKSKQQESQQQSQGVTLGTQGNSSQPTPHGDNISYPQQKGSEESRSIPNQENSSAANRDKADNRQERGEQ